MVPKKSRGRQKIDIVKMKNENNLQVTFSKRRAGLFKKASEICTLTGSEVALMVFSPGEKAYSFGSPSVSEIIERFESQTPHLVNSSNMIVEAHRRANVQNLNRELSLIENRFDAEKKRGERLNQLRKVNQHRHWWEGPFEELNMEQLEQLKSALEELQKNVKINAQKLTSESTAAHDVFPNFMGRRNGYGISAASPLSIFMPSVTSAFVPYESKPFPTLSFAPYAGPSIDNTGISIRNGPSFDIAAGANDQSGAASVAFEAKPSVFGLAGMPPHPYGFFHKGYGGGSF